MKLPSRYVTRFIQRWICPCRHRRTSFKSMEYKFLPRPSNASGLTPVEARALFRRMEYDGITSGFCVGSVQANVVVLPEFLADDFQSFCKMNSGPLPLLYRSKPGEFESPPLASNVDIR